MDIFYTEIAPVREHYDAAMAALQEPAKLRVETRGGDAGKLAAELLIQSRFGKSSEPVYTAQGKPAIPGGPHISISYSGDIAVLLTDNAACGVDAQPLDGSGRKAPVEVLTDTELRWLQDQLHNFMTLWTRKEAAMKAADDLCDPDPKTFHTLDRSNSVELAGKRFFIGSYAACGHVISWAAQTIGIPRLTHLDLMLLLA